MIQVTIKAIADCLEGDREELPALVERLSAKHGVGELLLCFEVAKEIASDQARATPQASAKRTEVPRPGVSERVSAILSRGQWVPLSEISKHVSAHGFTHTQVAGVLRAMLLQGRVEEKTLHRKGSPKAYKLVSIKHYAGAT